MDLRGIFQLWDRRSNIPLASNVSVGLQKGKFVWFSDSAPCISAEAVWGTAGDTTSIEPA